MNYKHIYMCIVAHAKSQQLKGLRPQNKNDLKRNFKNQYFEFHHILPKSMFPNWGNRESNIVPLTAREHFFCHQLLYKIYPTHSMICALYHLINRINYKENTKIKITSREYERIKIEFSKKHSQYEKEHSSSFGTHWYTNGAENVKAKECPIGFRPGRCGQRKTVDVNSKTYQKLFCPKKLTWNKRLALGLVTPNAKGSIHIHKADERKMVKPEELEKYLNEGWERGRGCNTWNKGKPLDETVRKRISEKTKGRKHTDEQKRRIGEKSKEMWMEEDFRTKMSTIRKSHYAIEENRKAVSVRSKEVWKRPGYRESQILKQKESHNRPAVKSKMSKAMLGMFWWNNGETQIRSKKKPAEDFVRGMLKRKKQLG